MRILHLTADYPDPTNPRKTRAIANLLDLAPGHEHRVYSLNRTAWRAPLTLASFEDDRGIDHRSVRYPGLSFGLGLHGSMVRLADRLATELEDSGFRPDLIHAHKLTIEGIAGDRLARQLGLPLALSIQGNTDLKIAGARPDLRGTYARIWKGAALAFPFAPWASARLNAMLGPRMGPAHCLPCAGPGDAVLTPIPAPPVIRTAFHFHDWRNKNAIRLFRAVARAAREVPQLVLEVIGSGDPATVAHLERQAHRIAGCRIRFHGSVPHAEMQALLNTSAAFALVSHRESFGMVFSEALLAGVPCLIPRGRAIDGYLPEGEVTLSADPRDTAGIARALVRLIREQKAFKTRLQARQCSGAMDFLRRPAIARTYLDSLDLLPDLQRVESTQTRLAAQSRPRFATQPV